MRECAACGEGTDGEFAAAQVEAVDELVEKAREMLSADAVEGAAEPRLQIGEQRVVPGEQLGSRQPARCTRRR